MHRLCEYTLISFKCQSIRSKVHCTNKTLHNESLKNVTVQLGPRVTCAKNVTKMIDGTEKAKISSSFVKCAARYNEFSSELIYVLFLTTFRP